MDDKFTGWPSLTSKMELLSNWQVIGPEIEEMKSFLRLVEGVLFSELPIHITVANVMLAPRYVSAYKASLLGR